MRSSKGGKEMNGKVLFSLLTALIISSCGNNGIPGTTTPVPSPTVSLIPTSSPTPTEIPATPTETGPREGDVTRVTENGHTYVYTYTNLGETASGEPVMENVRGISKFHLFDTPYADSITFEINILNKVLGERNLYEMIHKNFTDADIPADGIFDPTPITASLGPELRERYFSEDTRQLSDREKQIALQYEMLGQGESGHEQAFLEVIVPNGTPEGEVNNVKLSPNTGIILTIMDLETMAMLGGENILPIQMGDVMVYAQVYDVDAKGNMLCRLAFDKPMNEIDDEVLRNALFLFPASLAKQRDQRNIEQTDFSITLAHKSRWTQADGKTLDLEIERVPVPAQP